MQILEVFVEAVRQVFQETDIPIDAVEEKDSSDAEDQVVTSVGLTGDVKGIFMLLTDTMSATRIVRAMTGGLRITLKDDMLNEIQMAALGELSNQISGRAITLLSDRELHCDITPPAVLAARQLQSLVPDLATSFRMTVRGPFGRLTLFLGISAAPASE
jgi:chemotaxis protein CheX